MKKNLGSIIVLFLIFFTTNSFASKYTWTAKINKTTAHINEAIHLVYTCQFEDRAELTVIDFDPVGEYEDYNVELLKKYEKFRDGKRISIYEFVVFAKKTGPLVFEFDTNMKKTTRDSIENTVLGRDNAYYEEFSITKIKQQKLHVEILDINENIKDNLIGYFTLKNKLDKSKKKAYEPYHLEISIDGYGSLDLIKPIEFEIEGVKVFAQKPILDIDIDAKGRVGVWKQKFAFTSEKSFKIPAIDIKYFDLKTNSVQTMYMDAIDVDVEQSRFRREILLDEDQQSFTFDIEYLYYLLTFVAGFLAAKIKIKRKKTVWEKDPFVEKINNAQTLNELAIILVTHENEKYKDIIFAIDTKEITSLKEAKKRALDFNLA